MFRQGEEGDEFFIIQEGFATVSRKMDLNDTNSEEQVLATLEENQFFGEISLITNEKRSASIHAGKHELCCLKMSKHTFQDFVADEQNLINHSRLVHGREVVKSIPIFKGLSANIRPPSLDEEIVWCPPPSDRMPTAGQIFA